MLWTPSAVHNFCVHGLPIAERAKLRKVNPEICPVLAKQLGSVSYVPSGTRNSARLDDGVAYEDDEDPDKSWRRLDNFCLRLRVFFRRAAAAYDVLRYSIGSNPVSALDSAISARNGSTSATTARQHKQTRIAKAAAAAHVVRSRIVKLKLARRQQHSLFVNNTSTQQVVFSSSRQRNSLAPTGFLSSFVERVTVSRTSCLYSRLCNVEFTVIPPRAVVDSSLV